MHSTYYCSMHMSRRLATKKLTYCICSPVSTPSSGLSSLSGGASLGEREGVSLLGAIEGSLPSSESLQSSGSGLSEGAAALCSMNTSYES